MKELWYFILMILMLSILAGFSSMTTPTSAFVANLPPQWGFPTTEFRINGEQLELDLSDAFFDPDGDPLSFSVSPGTGVSAGVYGGKLVVLTDNGGSVTITASDGKSLVSQQISVQR